MEPEDIQIGRRSTNARKRILEALLREGKASKLTAQELLDLVARRFYGMGYRACQGRHGREKAA